MKKAILVTCDKDSVTGYRVVEIPDDFVMGVDDQYSDKVPFTIGSNQYLEDIEELSYFKAKGVNRT